MQKYMIHDVDKRLIHWINETLNPQKSLLIFDDGLKSQYVFSKSLNSDFQKVFAITPRFIELNYQLKQFNPKWNNYFKLSHTIYMDIVAKGYSVFMSLEDIDELLSQSNIQIALHGFSHDIVGLECCNVHYAMKLRSSYWNQFNVYPCYASKIAYCGFDTKTKQFIDEAKLRNLIHQEIECGMEWFYSHFRLQINLFVAPFNQLSDTLKSILKVYGLQDLSQNRIEL